MVYQITGFDRVNFVDDVANAVPQGEHCRITGLTFEADGVRANGQLTLWVGGDQYLTAIYGRLRAVRGLVSVQAIGV